MRKLFVRSVVAMILFACASRADAIGWDSDDFIISGGPSFSTMIAVYDHDFTFKGFLDNNFVTTAGMDFDANGNLVAAGGGNAREVRVYAPSGARIGGFASATVLINPGQLDVAPNGNYLIASGGAGGPPNAISAYEFTPEGALVHEFRSGGAFGVTSVPGNRLWSGRPGSTGVDIFDQATAASLGQTPVAGLNGVSSMFYTPTTQTVLIGTFLSNGVIETTLDGTVVRTFVNPAVSTIGSVTRGPNGEVFAIGRNGQSIFHWSADGTFLNEIAPPVTDLGFSVVVWAGNAPEPASCLLLGFGSVTAMLRRPRRA